MKRATITVFFLSLGVMSSMGCAAARTIDKGLTKAAKVATGDCAYKITQAAAICAREFPLK